ncbi:MAG: beta-ketoacyl-[acyl-carrier-protein] synthase family protein, partial [Thermoguttaceae bacterium]|nr:beta-ketoacyl-[acyl-carrier-protein] synthase family protein [Thermoguttaceae bacterium]
TEPERTGICFGSDYMISLPDEFTEGIRQCLGEGGQFERLRWPTDGLPRMSPLWLLKYLPNMPASHLAIYNDLRGPSNSITLREASAGAVIAEAFQTIVRDQADAMVVGCTGTRLHPLKTIHATQQEELATCNGDPTRACRPFDRGRTGMVLGEGAGAVVLEELAMAQRRGATVYGEVLGGSTSSAVGARLLARRGRAMRNALSALLGNAGVAPDAIGFVHAHGLSTRTCDAEEAWAIGQVFGGRARPVPVVAAKSYFGNLGAGGGMVEFIASVLALHHGRLFCTLNYEDPDPDCPLAVVTEAGHASGESFVSLGVTPQGQASAALVRRFSG